MDDRNSAQFGMNCRSLRKLRDLSQEDLADMVGCSTMTIQRIENCMRSPNFELACKICDVFDVSIDAMRGDLVEQLAEFAKSRPESLKPNQE